ncbi:MAG: flagellar basal body P-ring formation protein FlgA [Hyphomonas sp.]|nr:flagellar basal body P-ring formation protein FlgA [Hyphomonas sp.]
MSGLIALGLGAAIMLADSSALVASEVIRAGDMVTPANVTTTEGDSIGMAEPLIGREVRRTVYVGQSVTEQNTRAPMLVKRNQIVSLKFIRGPLEITTTGRAMGEAGLGEPVTVMNQQSKQLVQGTVQADGWVLAQ